MGFFRRNKAARGSDAGGSRAGGEEAGASRAAVRQRYEELARLGLALNREDDFDQLYATFSPQDWAADPYGLLIAALAVNEAEDATTPSLSRAVLGFDTECIYESEDYAVLVRDLAWMVAGEAEVSDIVSHFDPDAGEADVAFRLDGQDVALDLRVDDDWADLSFVEVIARHLAAREGRQLYWVDSGGQDVRIVLLAPAAAGELAALTDLDVAAIA